jgi:hypothetical protein
MVVPNLLLIAGTGNKSGKTTLACRVIEQFRDRGIVAIKITPHFHETTPGLKVLTEKPGYSVFEETNSDTTKDTSRMLRAGASKVFFARVNDNSLLDAFLEIIKQVPDGTPVVCESPALRCFAEPGQFVIMISNEAYNNKDISNLLKLPHVKINLADLSRMQSLPFGFDDGKWFYKK